MKGEIKGTHGGISVHIQVQAWMRDQRPEGVGTVRPRHTKADSRRQKNTMLPLRRQVHQDPETLVTDPRVLRDGARTLGNSQVVLSEQTTACVTGVLFALCPVSWSWHVEEGRCGPERESWAAGQSLLSRSRKLCGTVTMYAFEWRGSSKLFPGL